jgi:glucan biosynthesis protein C
MIEDLQPAEKKASRMLFVDNLRSAVIILVILHHVAVVYAANTPFYYVEPHGALTTGVLVVFQILNQAWFMGAFFLLSGCFSPGSLDRKGSRTFLKDRLVRLGIPILFYSFILSPIASIGIYQMPVSLTHITTPLSWARYPHFINFGPLWFAVMLLLFDFGYVGVRALTRKRAARSGRDAKLPSYPKVGAFMLLLAVASYLIRIVIPIGKYVLGFPSLFYLPQYLSFFCIGVAASRGNWLQTIPDSMGKRGLIAALAATVVLLPLALVGIRAGRPVGFLGGGYWQSADYALWDSIFSVGLVLGLITLFRRALDRQGKLAEMLSRHSFAVYVFHIPIIVFLAIAIRSVNLAGLLKFALLSIIAVPASFVVAYLVRKLPLASRVL